MEHYNPPQSPYLITDYNPPKYITSREKIHRIRCLVGYHAEVMEIISPSEIWIRLMNHITDNLVLSKNNPPDLETDIYPNVYVMVPFNATQLARARIIRYDPNTEMAIVRYIDRGNAVKIPKNYLYKMNDEFRTHPWQAILVSLHNVVPENDEEWSIKEATALRAVMEQFPYVWVIPQLTSHFVNDDAEPNRVFLNGLTHEDLETIVTTQRSNYADLGEGIIELYYLELSTAASTPKPIIDSMDYSPFPVEEMN